MHTKTSSLKSKLLKAAVPLALACAFTAAPAMAKETAVVPAAAPQITAQQQNIANRIGMIQQELAGIRHQTLQSHPELVKELKAYETAFNNKVKAKGYNPEKLIKRAQEIQLEARKEGLSNAKRTELVKEFTNIRMELAKQQKSILSDPAISKQDKQVQKDVLTAMKKQDPKAEKLLTELDSLVKQFKS
ncbi:MULTISPECIES: hypothetical protein [unclassified Photobacterium]|uniref:hypothetical protein n=1 Tax=unclassified Photobacterium TaxID=2628852 RepID=UPI001EE0EDF6|nr:MULTISPECIES: hypothetical protein [unclassified Photobacterium]MCG3863304.1 hypothetical protein [Photobacterium sp. Ph6]MCG3874834.1 hypothetical protein [Photobacterium sp. Ph5]